VRPCLKIGIRFFLIGLGGWLTHLKISTDLRRGDDHTTVEDTKNNPDDHTTVEDTKNNTGAGQDQTVNGNIQNRNNKRK